VFYIGWLDLLALRLHSLNYNKYSAIADLQTYPFTVAPALGFSVVTGCILGTDLNTETVTSNHYEVFSLFRLQSPWNLGTQLKTLLLLTPPAYDCPQTTFVVTYLGLGPTENTSRLHALLCDVTAYAQVCLPSRCLETGCITPLFHCCVYRGVLSSRCLAMRWHVTVFPWRSTTNNRFPHLPLFFKIVTNCATDVIRGRISK
jgi:hypothetical protein